MPQPIYCKFLRKATLLEKERSLDWIFTRTSDYESDVLLTWEKKVGLLVHMPGHRMISSCGSYTIATYHLTSLHHRSVVPQGVEPQTS